MSQGYSTFHAGGFGSQVERMGATMVAVFVFATLSALHLESSLLVKLNFEAWLILLLGTLYLPAWVIPRDPWPTLALALGLVTCLAVAPLLSSLANEHDLRVLSNPEYRSWVKALFVFPLVPWVCRRRHAREVVVEALIFAVVVFSLIVQYRFHVLGEMRLFDDRPKVLVKNGDPNFICTLTAVAIPFVLYKLRAQTWRWAPKFIYRAVACLFFYTVLVTESRMGLVSIVAGLLVFAWASPRKSAVRGISFVAVGGMIVATLFLGDTFGRFRRFADKSNVERWRSIVTGWNLTLERPVFGFGWGESANHFYRITGHDRLRSEASPLAVHNTPLQVSGELGLVGLVAFASLGIVTLLSAYNAFRRREFLGVAAASALIILSLNLLTLPLQSKDFIILYLAVILAISLPLPAKAEALC